jgi:MscS family membrane protein
MGAPVRPALYACLTVTLFGVGGVAKCLAQGDSPSAEQVLKQKLGSPRATFRTFFSGMKEGGDIQDAILCLEPSAGTNVNLREAAYELHELLKTIANVDRYESVTNAPDDGSTYELSEFAQDERLTPDQRNAAAGIQLTRGEDGLWRFSEPTLVAVSGLLKSARSRQPAADVTQDAKRPWSTIIRDLFPDSFQRKHFFLRNDQWICLLVLIFLGFLADSLVRFSLHNLSKTWFKLTGDKQVATAEWKLWKPMGLLTQALVWYGGTMLLGLPDFVQTVLLYGLKVFAIVAAVWTGFLVIDLISAFLARKALGTDTKFDDLLIPLVSKSLKLFAVCIGAITCAQTFNLPLAGLLGGLGIGGAAIAFASKDAIANLFGSVTVLTDRPFEIGDWIKTEDVEGTVESVGFRSSRIRTFYNSLITLPNCRLTTAIVDNMGRRRYRRITATLGIQYDTNPEQIEAFCEGIRELIRRHPYTRKDYYHVYLNGFSDSSLDVMLYCFVECPDWAVELREKHRLFVDIIKLAEKLGVSFAFPTRTLHLYQEEIPSGKPPLDLADPALAAQRLAATIAGPLPAPEDRPGGVEFRGPTPVDRKHEGPGYFSGLQAE